MNPEYARRDKDVRNVGDTLQANWIPLALIGVGMAWLLTSNTGVAERIANDGRMPPGVGHMPGDLGIGSDATHGTRHGAQIVGSDGRPLRESGDTGRGDGWVSQATVMTRQTLGSVREAGNAVLDRASRYTDYAGGASEMAKRATNQLAESLQREPWLIGIAGMIAGVVLAVLLPPTQVEQDYVAELRDQLWTKASELGHQAAERVRELAEPTNAHTSPHRL